MAMYNSINANTVKNMQLDAGVLVLGDVNTDKFTGLGEAPLLGATKGATSFSAIPQLRNIFEGLDGCRGYYKGGTVIDAWDVTLKTTITEMTKENIMRTLNATTSSASQDGKFDYIEPSDEIASTGYLDVISWVGTMAGSNEPIIIKLYNVLNMSGFNLGAEDKNTGSVEVEFRAHMKLGSKDKLFKICVPKHGAVGITEFEEHDIHTLQEETEIEIKKKSKK